MRAVLSNVPPYGIFLSLLYGDEKKRLQMRAVERYSESNVLKTKPDLIRIQLTELIAAYNVAGWFFFWIWPTSDARSDSFDTRHPTVEFRLLEVIRLFL